MLLGLDFDKSFDKKIQFSFTSSEARKEGDRHRHHSHDVDVDVGNFFSTMEAINRNPVRYAASFKSKAKVGLLIPPTVSPDHIGPGSFPGAFKPSVVISNPDKPSHTFLRERKFHIPHTFGDELVAVKPFAEVNPKGPIFNKEGEKFDKNAQLVKIVKDKMTKIYPQLARKKFVEAENQNVEITNPVFRKVKRK
jgi:hypothetical protein